MINSPSTGEAEDGGEVWRFRPTEGYFFRRPLPGEGFDAIFVPWFYNSRDSRFFLQPRADPEVTMSSISNIRRQGEIHVITGPMFAGKSTSLLRRVTAEAEAGRNVVMIKSSKDTRYAVDSVVTHDGTKFPCWPTSDLLAFKRHYGPELYKELDVIGIDEAQFFDDLYDFCREAADIDGKIVVVAGLDGDYLRRRFGSILDIIPLADTVTKLTARCEVCGKRAFFTHRKTKETETQLIGGKDVYMPVCRLHYCDNN